MADAAVWNIAWLAGLVLVISFIAQFPGLMMFWLRAGHKGGKPRSRAHFVVERCFIMAAAVLGPLGFVLLAAAREASPGYGLALAGAAGTLFGGVFIISAEALSLTIGYEKMYPIVNIYVVLTFLAQALVGVALLPSGLTAAWAGWACIGWNLFWLAAIPRLSPRDIYFPILHSVMPLVIGIAVLVR
jgi:hypothetical protein